MLASSLFVNNIAHAYLDPGSAGIIQMLLAGLVGAFTYVLVYFKKFKNFIKSIFSRKQEEKKDN